MAANLDKAAQPAGSAPDEVPNVLRLAAAILVLESLALVAAAVVLVVKTIAGHPADVGRALVGAVLALVGAACLLLGARGVRRMRPAARSPVVVLQLLALPVSYSLAFQAGRVAYGGPIMLAALVVIYLLFTPPARAALDRDPPR